MLDRNVVEMMILNVGCGFNLDQPPALVFATMENIYSDEDVHRARTLPSKIAGTSRFAISSRVARIALSSLRRCNLDSTRKHLACEQPDFAPLLDDRFCRTSGSAASSGSWTARYRRLKHWHTCA